MMRFVDLGRQLHVDESDLTQPRQFAFFDTVTSTFISIEGYCVFDSLGELLQVIELEGNIDERFANRIMRSLPEWVRIVPVTRNNTQTDWRR